MTSATDIADRSHFSRFIPITYQSRNKNRAKEEGPLAKVPNTLHSPQTNTHTNSTNQHKITPMPSTPASARTSSSFPPRPPRKHHLFSAQDNGFVRTSSSNLQNDHSRPTSPTTTPARKQHSRSPPPQIRPRSPLTSPRSPSPTATSTFILPGKRGKVTRLILVAVILFPPVAFFFLAMLPFLLVVSGKTTGFLLLSG